jgi:hypothetical protein
MDPCAVEVQNHVHAVVVENYHYGDGVEEAVRGDCHVGNHRGQDVVETRIVEDTVALDDVVDSHEGDDGAVVVLGEKQSTDRYDGVESPGGEGVDSLDASVVQDVVHLEEEVDSDLYHNFYGAPHWVGIDLSTGPFCFCKCHWIDREEGFVILIVIVADSLYHGQRENVTSICCDRDGLLQHRPLLSFVQHFCRLIDLTRCC